MGRYQVPDTGVQGSFHSFGFHLMLEASLEIVRFGIDVEFHDFGFRWSSEEAPSQRSMIIETLTPNTDPLTVPMV